MHVFIHASVETPRTASLLSHRELAKALCNWTCRLVQQTLVSATITLLVPGYGKDDGLRNLVENVLAGSVPWYELARNLNADKDPLLIISPFDGHLSQARLHFFVRQLLELPPPGVACSTCKVDRNVNPHWLKSVPQNGWKNGITIVDWGQQDAACLRHFNANGAEEKNTVCGSQYLPDLYMKDRALFGITGESRQRATFINIPYAPEEDASLPLCYRFSLFNLHPEQKLAIEEGFTSAMSKSFDNTL